MGTIHQKNRGLQEGLDQSVGRRCTFCLTVKPIDCFSPDRRRAIGVQAQCKDCRRDAETARRQASPELDEHRREMSRKWFKNNRERAYASRLDWKRKNPERVRGYQTRLLYGVAVDAVEALRKSQNNRCAICEREFAKTPHTDHDHETGSVRGLLCGGCNLGLGVIEKPGFLKRAQNYLERSRHPRHT